MATSKLDLIKKAALQAARRKHKIDEPFVRAVIEDKSSGRTIFHCHVGSLTAANEAAVVISLDENGKEVEVDESYTHEVRHTAPHEHGAGAGQSGHAGHEDTPTAPVFTAAPVTIQPTENILTLNPGDSHTEVITVKVSKSGVAPKVDVYFLADTTASMASILAAVKAGASSILSSLTALGSDFHFGVGNYRDFPIDAYAFQHQQGLTNIGAAVTTAINAWFAGGGGDSPEGQLYALNKLAEPVGGMIGWRASAKRIVVWFGDQPGHDPVCTGISGEPTITESSVTTKLVGEGITVLAISVMEPGLDGDPTAGATSYVPVCGAPGGTAGQGTRIANATGGQFVGGINAGNIVNTITNLVTATVGTINNLKLVASGGTAPFVASITPAAGFGPLAVDREHELKFEVVFRGQPCTEQEQVFTGTLDAVADGKVVASKRIQITVPACPKARFRYSVKFVCGQQLECGCECLTVRPGIYATDINIHNYHDVEVTVEKLITPVVFVGAAVGREPQVARPKATDKIVLRPHTATMDDCCRVAELLLGGKAASPMPLTIGFLEISSSHELAITAVYTVSDSQSHSVSIDVEQIEPAIKPR